MSKPLAPMPKMMFKICPDAEWSAAVDAGTYIGSPDDKRDGFIHFSTAGQLEGTLRKHFAGQKNLVLVAVETAVFGSSLKWEPSRDGSLFPHLYGTLPTSAATSVFPLPLDENGRHRLPENME